MNFLRRLFGPLLASGPVPAWANFFTLPQYRLFLGHVKTHFRQQNQRITLGEGVILLDKASPEGFQQLGLLNLAQVCAGAEENLWPDIIADHFRTLHKSHCEQMVLEERIEDFSRVKELLAVRLWPENYLADLSKDRFIHRQDLAGTLTALVFDLPSSVRNVTPDEAKKWRKTPGELFEIGLRNVWDNCIPDVTEQDLGEGVTVTVLSDESFFVASHSLLLDQHEDCVGTYGALVGVPHRHVLMSYPIEDLRVILAVNMMIPIILGMEKEGPGSISPHLYWYRDGKFMKLPYEVKDKALHFAPPQKFVDVLNMLNDPDD